MKNFKLITSAFGLALALGSGVASADIVKKADGTPVMTDQGGTTEKYLVGSDTLNRIMDCLVNGCSGVPALGLAQINNYLGQGSNQGQRALEGSPAAGTDEPPCTVGGATDPNGLPETNPGCQEIAPMSREMNKDICDDDISTLGGVSGSNATGESLAVCGDGIVITTDNKSIAQTADTTGDCAATPVAGFTGDSTNPSPYQPATKYAASGKLRRSGSLTTSVGTYALSDWKDVLRVIYTGCKNTDGTCATVDRYTRCVDPVRRAVVNDWFDVVEDGAKGGIDTAVKCDGTNGTPNNALCTAGVDGGLRHAYRRDDSSGTTTFFLSTLGLGTSVTHRATWTAGVALKPTAINGTADMYCDGGDVESYSLDAISCTPGQTSCPDYSTLPATPNAVVCPSYGVCPAAPAVPNVQASCTPGATNACRDFLHDQPAIKSLTCPASGLCPAQPALGDPITKPCRAEDNLCSWTGRSGVVKALVTPATVGTVAPYPTLQCSRGKFALVPYINTSFALCPDGSVPQGGQCLLPYFQDTSGAKHFNCMSDLINISNIDVLGTDGRSFNFVMRDDNGVVQCLSPAGATAPCTLPAVAQWREDMAVLKTSLPIGGTINADPNSTATPRARCQTDDTTHLMGCVLANTQCSVGFAGREMGDSPDSIAQGQEPLRVNATVADNDNVLNFLADTGVKICASASGLGSHTLCSSNTDCTVVGETCVASSALAPARIADYPFARNLYLAAIGGFANITSDCVARGGSAAYCADEVKIVNAFMGANYDTVGGPVCASAGFITLPATQNDLNGAAQPLRECRGAADPGATAGTCGATGPPRQDGSFAPTDNCQPM